MDMQSALALLQALRGGAQPVSYKGPPAPIKPTGGGGGAPGGPSFKPVAPLMGGGLGPAAPDLVARPTQGPRHEAISKALDAGKSYGQIAKELGISRNAVAGTVRDLGLTKNPVGQRDPYTLDPVELANTRERLNPGKVDPELRGAAAQTKAQPSLPQLNFQKGQAPAEDPEMAQMMTNYLRSMGIVE